MASVPEMNHVYHGIYIGGHKALQSHILAEARIQYVVNAAVELVHGLVDWASLQQNGVSVQHVPMEDVPHQLLVSPSTQVGLQVIHHCVMTGQPVLVNCYMGISRSSSLVIAYLILYQNMSFEEAFHIVRSGRQIANPNPGFVAELQHIAATRYQVSGPVNPPDNSPVPYNAQIPYIANGYGTAEANSYAEPPKKARHGGVRGFLENLRNR